MNVVFVSCLAQNIHSN